MGMNYDLKEFQDGHPLVEFVLDAFGPSIASLLLLRIREGVSGAGGALRVYCEAGGKGQNVEGVGRREFLSRGQVHPVL